MTPPGRSPAQTPRRVAGYVRLSRATDESTSPQRQRDAIAAECARRGWELVAVLDDVDVSATKRRLARPGLDEARRLAREGRVDAVMVWRLDRLARSVSDLSALAEEWDAAGVAIVSATEPFDATTSAGKMLLQLLGVFAEFEARVIRDRVLDSRAGLARARRWAGGRAPYGYRAVAHPGGAGRGLEIDPDEAAHVRAAADHVLGGGTLYGACALLQERGARPRLAEHWSVQSLRSALTGDAVLGRMTHAGEVVRDEDGYPLEVWTPVLPLADVERLRAALAPRKAADVRRRASRLLSGLLACGTCGARLRVSWGNGHARYACHGKYEGSGCAAPVSMRAEPLEAHVADEYLATHGHFAATRVVERVREVAGLAAVEEALRLAAAEMIRPGADVGALALRVAELSARRDALAAAPAAPVVELVDTGHTIAEEWERGDVDGRRRLLEDALGGYIVVAPGRRGPAKIDTGRVAAPWLAGGPWGDPDPE